MTKNIISVFDVKLFHLLTVLLAILFTQDLFAQKAFRLVKATFIIPVTYSDGDSEDDYYKIEDSKRKPSGYALGIVLKNGFGIGLSSSKHITEQTTTFKTYFNYVSGTEETVNLDFWDLSYTFGESVPFTIGIGILRSGDAEVEYSNPACSQFSRTSSAVSGGSYFMDLGIPVSDPYKVILGYRYTYANLNFSNVSGDYPRWYRDFSLGASYSF
ncbi:MAG: hypothetical protein MJE63_10950 [Proteobacteria bacterium]|nr:hypothetical protein [Pseudomonadota bacterium]